MRGGRTSTDLLMRDPTRYDKWVKKIVRVACEVCNGGSELLYPSLGGWNSVFICVFHKCQEQILTHMPRNVGVHGSHT